MTTILIVFASLISVLGIRTDTGVVVQHGMFSVQDGIIKPTADQRFRWSVLGALKAGSPITLGACTPHAHEKFKMSNGQIMLLDNPSVCLNAKGGVAMGAEIVTYKCNATGAPGANEKFLHAADGRIRTESDPNLCLNIKEGKVVHGTSLVLYECGKSKEHIHDVFDYRDHTFVVRQKPQLRLYAKDLEGTGEVSLGGCDHQHFDFDSKTKQIRLRDTDLCINAEGGIGVGAALIAWQCTQKDKVPENEQFLYDARRGVIISVLDPALIMSVKEANVEAGSPIVLYPLIFEDM